MYYNYNFKGKNIKIFRFDPNEFNPSVDVYMDPDNPYTSIRRTIKKEISVDGVEREYIKIEKDKLYLDTWIRTSCEEFYDKIHNGIYITTDLFCQMLLTEGIENLIFEIPMNVRLHRAIPYLLDGTKTKKVPCKIVEEYNREVRSNYKLKFITIEYDDTVGNTTDYYTYDLLQFIKHGEITVKVKEK